MAYQQDGLQHMAISALIGPGECDEEMGYTPFQNTGGYYSAGTYHQQENLADFPNNHVDATMTSPTFTAEEQSITPMTSEQMTRQYPLPPHLSYQGLYPALTTAYGTIVEPTLNAPTALSIPATGPFVTTTSPAPDPPKASYTCPKCGETLSTKGSLHRHDKEVHGNVYPYECPVLTCHHARFGWARKGSLQTHMRKVHKMEPDLSHLPAYLANPKKRGPKTPGPGQRPDLIAQVTAPNSQAPPHQHAPLHPTTLSNMFPAADSSSALPSKSCGKPFSFPAMSLPATGQPATTTPSLVPRPPSTSFTCLKCGKQLTTQRNLLRHDADVHAESRPFVCPVQECDYATVGYARKDALIFHMKTAHSLGPDLGHLPAHLSERKKPLFVCLRCGADLASPTGLDKHVASVHAEAHAEAHPYVCPERNCKYARAGFASRDALKRHMKRMHDLEPDLGHLPPHLAEPKKRGPVPGYMDHVVQPADREGYERGRSDGYDLGHGDGYGQGFENGYEEGRQLGHQEGYAKGIRHFLMGEGLEDE